MSCDNITTGGDVDLNSGTLPSNFCHTSWQATYNAFIAATSVSFTNGAVFSAGSTNPDNTGHIWLKQNPSGCAPLGWYYHDGSDWNSPVPVPQEALPSGVVSAGTKGAADKNAVITVDTYGRVTSLTEVDPTAESTDGHAKAWTQFQHSEISSLPASKNFNVSSITTTGTGFYQIATATGLFSNVCVAVASHPGFGTDQSQSSASYTGADHVRVLSTTVAGNGSATVSLELPRMQNDGGAPAGSANPWDNENGDAPTAGVNVVMFGN
tara:strand:- start:981 stop:1781 length:801 start_codon:yes stop_codon:yes gene_type:complete